MQIQNSGALVTGANRGLASTSAQVGGALGLAVLAALSRSQTERLLAAATSCRRGQLR